MKGLLLKDCFVLFKQMRIMLLILVIWSCIPGFALAPFAVFYAAMLPVTALAYDERSKWDELAVMMPYSARDIVLSKYVLGVLCIAVAAILAAAAQCIVGAVRGTGFAADELIALAFVGCLSTILLCINLPLMFRMGVEKGRIAFMILTCGGVVACMALRDRLLTALERFHSAAVPVLGLLALVIAVFAVSVPVAVGQYQRRNG